MPKVATLICILFILYLFLNDRKKNESSSLGLWVPFIWMFLAGSRYVTGWLNLYSTRSSISVDAYADGSPADAAFFFLLIALGIFILAKRNIDWGQLLARNKWVWLYFAYCGLSILWSDAPFVSFKRLIKELGNPVMVLVILTEDRPYEAIGIVMRRLAFVLLPLSYLFIRYYPDLGRGYGYTGSPMYTGAATDKNGLGHLCLMAGIYFIWSFIYRKGGFKLLRSNIPDFIMLGLTLMLIQMAHSATATACLVFSAGLFFFARTGFIKDKPGRLLAFGAFGILLFFALDSAFHLYDLIVGLLGRRHDLTDRVPIWGLLQGMRGNPLVGTGFMSFWTGSRMNMIWEKTGSNIIQAHNGYLEQYLNLGGIGVVFIIAIMLSGLLKVRRQLDLDYPFALLRLCFIANAVLYNYTEASFYGINNMWLLLLLGVVEVSRPIRPGYGGVLSAGEMRMMQYSGSRPHGY